MVEVELASDKPVAMICARLCDIHPDGASERVSYGLLNLTHRESHEHPSALQPGRRYRVRVRPSHLLPSPSSRSLLRWCATQRAPPVPYDENLSAGTIWSTAGAES